MVSAQELSLIPPVLCDLTEDCYIQQYVDHDPSPASGDFTCNGLSYDGHKGTDFAVATLADMAKGVPVVSAAAGIVSSLRDGMPDVEFTEDTAAAVEGRECGNGVVLRHPGGWETQYCHLREGSVAVTQGQRVAVGTQLGLIGMSGRAAFPHVHLSVRRDGAIVDPFDPDGTVTCAAPGDSTLWAQVPQYQPGGLLQIGFSDAVPEYAAVKAGTAARENLTVDAPALVLFAFSFGVRQGDALQLEITGPKGVVVEQTVTLEKRQARGFRAIGKRARRGWLPGVYTGTATLLRGDTQISQRTRQITLR